MNSATGSAAGWPLVGLLKWLAFCAVLLGLRSAVAQEIVRLKSLRQQGWQVLDEQKMSGLEVVVCQWRINQSGGPVRVLLLVRPSGVLQRPLPLTVTLKGRLEQGSVSVLLPKRRITLPSGSGSVWDEFVAVPLVFPAPVEYLHLSLTSPQRRTSFFLSWWSTRATETLLRVSRRQKELLNGFAFSHDVVHPDVLPEHWPLLTGYGIVVIDLPDLERIRRQRPRTLEALSNWVHAGGVLLVRAEAPDAQAQQRLLRRTGTQLQPGVSENELRPFLVSKAHLRQTEWSERNPRRARGTAWPPNRQPGEEAQAEEEKQLLDAKIRRELARLKQLRFYGLGVGAGLVAVVPKRQWNPNLAVIVPLVPSVYPALGTVNTAIDYNTAGMFGTADSTLHIPEVGNPPVFVFLGMISLFVLVVGPLNYFWFRRQGALHRLLLTVPGASLLTTLVLLGYVLFSEGLDHKGRFVSLSWVYPSGKQVTWATGAYFSAIPPREGLVFPLDTAVFFDPATSSDSVAYFDWDRQQHFQAGWIQARSLRRLFLARVRRSSRTVRFVSPGGNQPPRVTNRLGTTVRLLLAKDREGKLWWVRNLPAEQTVALRPADPAQTVTGPLRRKLDQVAEQTLGRGVLERTQQPVLKGEAVAYANSPHALHWHLRRLARWLDRGGQAMPPGSWLAVVADNPELPTGTELTVIEGFHVMVGHWP